ncbi:serpin 42Da F, partial [Aphelenchoides avenae]
TNEEGSEAAAATGMKIMLLSASVHHAEPLRFIADHAFAYAISNKAGDVLFFGRISQFP